MNVQPARGYLGISEVLAELRADFPDVSVSKIRFLEAEGLIAPARSPAGYRRFRGPDLDRLRFILTAQRDQYLPLRVIRERLAQRDKQASADSGIVRPGPQRGDLRAGRPAGTGGRVPGPPGLAGPGEPGPGEQGAQDVLLTRRELVEAAGLSEALLTELETFGLLRHVGRRYSRDALEVARTAAALASFGVEARHLRAVRAAAERETTMIESLVAPVLRQRSPGARQVAAETARDCAALVLRLHAALVDATLTEAGLARAGTAAGGHRDTGPASGADGQAPPRRAGGAGSATA